jgi:two-component system chemotaxis response regulator CheY
MDTLAEDLVDVLFIEGESDIAELYRHKLDLDGYRVTLAKPVGDSLDFDGRAQPDIVFIEVSPTDSESIASFKALREDDRMRNVPAIILSRVRESEFRERGINLGTLDYLVSPPAAMSLWTIAEDAFARRSVPSAGTWPADVQRGVGSRIG